MGDQDADLFASIPIAVVDKHGILKEDLSEIDQNEEVAASLYTLAVFLGRCLDVKGAHQRLFSAKAIATEQNLVVHVSGGGVAHISPLASPVNTGGVRKRP